MYYKKMVLQLKNFVDWISHQVSVDLLEVGQQARLRGLVLLQEHDLELEIRRGKLLRGCSSF